MNAATFSCNHCRMKFQVINISNNDGPGIVLIVEILRSSLPTLYFASAHVDSYTNGYLS